MSLPLEGVRVVEVAQYVAGPLAGLAARRARRRGDQGRAAGRRRLPAGDARCGRVRALLRPAQPWQALGRARSQVRRRPRARSRSSSAPPTSSSTTRRRRARRRSGSAGRGCIVAHPALVVGVVTSFGPHGPLAGLPAYDLVAQGRSGLLTSHASPATGCRCAPAGSRWPTSRRGTCSRPACWRRSFARGRRGRGSSSRCRCSVPRSPCRSRISSGSRVRPTAVPPPRPAPISRRAPTRSPAASR